MIFFIGMHFKVTLFREKNTIAHVIYITAQLFIEKSFLVRKIVGKKY